MMGEAAEKLGLGSLLQDIGGAMPGIDEAMEFSVVVFDTAPIEHNLRFLSFPDILEKSLGKMEAMKNQFGGMFKQFSSMMGMDGAEGTMVRCLCSWYRSTQADRRMTR